MFHLRKKITNRISFVLQLVCLVTLLCPSLSAAENVTIESKASRTTVGLNEEFDVDIFVTWPEEALNFQTQKITTPHHPHFQLMEATQKSSSTAKDGAFVPVTHYHYRFKAIKGGEASLSAFVLELKSPGETVLLKRGEDIEMNVVGFFARRAGILGFVIFIFFLGIAGFFIFRFRVKKNRTRMAENIQKVENDTLKDLEFQVQTEIDGLKKCLVEGNQAEYFRRLKKIIENYIERRFSVSFSSESWEDELAVRENGRGWHQIIKKINQISEQISFAGGDVQESERKHVLREIDRRMSGAGTD